MKKREILAILAIVELCLYLIFTLFKFFFKLIKLPFKLIKLPFKRSSTPKAKKPYLLLKKLHDNNKNYEISSSFKSSPKSTSSVK